MSGATDEQQMSNNTDAGLSVPLTGQVAVGAVVLMFAIFAFVLVIYLRVNGYSGTTGSFRSRRFAFAPQDSDLPRHALDPSILNSIPITVFRTKQHDEDGSLECAVCLCELEEGEEVRMLPKCNHGFHVDCIDMWFHSNNTCPLCRNLVSTETTEVQIQMQPPEAVSETGDLNLNEEASSSAGSSSSSSSSMRKRKEGMLVIDIPRRQMGGAFSASNTPLQSSKVPSDSPLPTSRLLEEVKSPAFGRMRSFKRMLSRGSFKGMGSSPSPIGCHDIEQGGLAESKCQ